MGTPSRVLFVCAGNTCRSPIAAALAQFLLPDTEAESAGWSPQETVPENAVTVIRETTGLDVSSYHPRDVADVDLTTFDRIIVLDPHVAAELDLPPDPTHLVWDIPDPYGGSLEEYKRCVALLRERIEVLARGD